MGKKWNFFLNKIFTKEKRTIPGIEIPFRRILGQIELNRIMPVLKMKQTNKEYKAKQTKQNLIE